MANPKPFSAYEWMIAWRYLRARKSEGGVSVMTWISLIGIALAVFALIATLAVRSGFRAEFVDTILGANAHATIYNTVEIDVNGVATRTISNYDERAESIRQVPGVTSVAPLVRGEVMVSSPSGAVGVQVYGMTHENLLGLDRIADAETSIGDINEYPNGVAIGSGVARELAISVGDQIKLISPDGLQTLFGTSPRIKSYPVTYIFTAGRYDIDRTRIYMPFAEAQSFFNREGVVDELEVRVEAPEQVEDMTLALLAAGGERTLIWTWKDASGAFLRALEIEDNVMFIILSILVLIATMNIVSGLIMLVKNKGRDIGILRTFGLTEGAVLRVFFICGASIGVVGTLVGVVLGCLFTIYIDPIFSAVNHLSGGGVWDPSVRGIYNLPAQLRVGDVVSAVSLSLGLSFVITIFPARRAARMNPVEALRYE